ncbi:HNH endonuclease [Ureibacillus sinduriensis]|nr:HNH endonuclease [Ureibacillus sinduriensis]
MDKDKLYDLTKRNQESKQFYASSSWAKARELALIRDKYLCQSCLKKKRFRKAEVVHHIKELRDHPELGLELSNLISWCNKCHTSHHKSSDTKSKNIKTKIEVVTTKTNIERF